jgi:hypothetical protein
MATRGRQSQETHLTTLSIDTALFKSLAPGGPKGQVVDRMKKAGDGLAMTVLIAQQVARLVPARSSQEKAAGRGDSFSACPIGSLETLNFGLQAAANRRWKYRATRWACCGSSFRRRTPICGEQRRSRPEGAKKPKLTRTDVGWGASWRTA